MVSFPRSKQNKMPHVYKCSWFESETHKKSHTSTYFEEPEYFEDMVFGRDWKPQVCRVYYIEVSEDSNEFRMAKLNTERALEEE